MNKMNEFQEISNRNQYHVGYTENRTLDHDDEEVRH